MRNAQLSQRERTVVHQDADSKRILGFSPEGFSPPCPPGTKVVSTVLYSANAIERWAERFREQSIRDREETSLRRLEAERPIRQSIRDAIIARSRHLDPKNQDINASLLKVMDHFYESSIARRQAVEVAIAAEKYEEGKKSEDITLENTNIRLGAPSVA